MPAAFELTSTQSEVEADIDEGARQHNNLVQKFISNYVNLGHRGLTAIKEQTAQTL